MKEATIAQLIGLVGAITGLGSVVISYLMFLHNVSKTKPKIKVEAKRSFLLFQKKESEEVLSIKVANYGQMPFTIVHLGIKVGRHSGGLMIPNPKGTVKLPYELKPESTCNFWADYEELKPLIKAMTSRHKIRIRIYTSDYVGRTFRSKYNHYILEETRRYKLRILIASMYQKILKFLFP